MTKHFTEADVRAHTCIAWAGSIAAETSELIDAPLDWQQRGLQQTASGYGRKLTTSRKISFCGKVYRLYCTCFSNSGSVWFKANGRTIYVN